MVAIDCVADRGCHWNDGAADAADLRIILVATGGRRWTIIITIRGMLCMVGSMILIVIMASRMRRRRRNQSLRIGRCSSPTRPPDPMARGGVNTYTTSSRRKRLNLAEAFTKDEILAPNCHHTQLTIPFIAYTNVEEWNTEHYLYHHGVKQWRQHNHHLLELISQSIHTTMQTNMRWVHHPPHHQEDNPLWRHWQERLERLSAIYGHDTQVLERELFIPLSFTQVLPDYDAISNENDDPSFPTTPTHQATGSENDNVLAANPVSTFLQCTATISSTSNSSSSYPSTDNMSGYNDAGQVIAHLVRDWTSEGASIRANIYGWCIQQVQQYIKRSEVFSETTMTTTPSDISTTDVISKTLFFRPRSFFQLSVPRRVYILVPGAGLGRCAWDLFQSIPHATVEAVELAPAMAATAAALFQRFQQGTIHPYASDFLTNEVHSHYRYQAVSFPDCDIRKQLEMRSSSNLPASCYASKTSHLDDNNDHDDDDIDDDDEGGEEGTATVDAHRRVHYHSANAMRSTMSYTVADFRQLGTMMHYQDRWDCIVTCFFIDTATNVLEYMDTIQRLLQPKRGVWINVGPLQWHRNAKLVLSANELHDVIQYGGFDILEWSIDTSPVEYRSRGFHPRNEILTPPDCQCTSVSRDPGGIETECYNHPYPSTEHSKCTHYDAYFPLRFVAKWNGSL